jgi:hypothetical protein
MNHRVTHHVQQQIYKRMTLNLLIQGAATHTFMTAHHLVKGQLDAIHPKLVRLYDQFPVGMFLGYWYGDVALTLGRPKKFWRRVETTDHPFYGHPLLTRFGGELTEAARLHTRARAKEKGVAWLPGPNYLQTLSVFLRTHRIERHRRPRLEELAREATQMIWGIDPNRLSAKLTWQVEFGNIREPATAVGRMIRNGAAGYSGVIRRGSQFQVVAKAWTWPLLIHELVKGTTELVCLHGLNTLDKGDYLQVVNAADHIEYETWQMQAGSELWRRLLAALPTDRPLAECLMYIARLSPARLDLLMQAVAERSPLAREQIADLFPAVEQGPLF